MQISNLRQQLQEARKEFAVKQRALEVHLQLLQVASIEISTSGNLYCIFILRNRFRALPQAEVDAKKQEIQEHRQAEQEAKASNSQSVAKLKAWNAGKRMETIGNSVKLHGASPNALITTRQSP